MHSLGLFFFDVYTAVTILLCLTRPSTNPQVPSFLCVADNHWPESTPPGVAWPHGPCLAFKVAHQTSGYLINPHGLQAQCSIWDQGHQICRAAVMEQCNMGIQCCVEWPKANRETIMPLPHQTGWTVMAASNQ